MSKCCVGMLDAQAHPTNIDSSSQLTHCIIVDGFSPVTASFSWGEFQTLRYEPMTRRLVYGWHQHSHAIKEIITLGLLVDDGVDADGGLSCLTISDNQLTLPTTNRDKGVHGLQAGLVRATK